MVIANIQNRTHSMKWTEHQWALGTAWSVYHIWNWSPRNREEKRPGEGGMPEKVFEEIMAKIFLNLIKT